jgi:hypothetical protein
MELETTKDEEESSQSLPNLSDLSHHKEDMEVLKTKMTLRSRGTCQGPGAVPDREKDHDDADDDNDPSGHRTRSGPGHVNVRRKRAAPLPSSSGSSFPQTSPGETSRSHRTQACLTSLEKGQQLDANYPNVASHSMAAGITKSPIDFKDLVFLSQEQLAHSLDQYCEPLEMKGKYRAVGTLFKLTLAQYGYTFVGKGGLQEFIQILTHAAKVINRLESLQGEAVPVYLRSIALTQPYCLTALEAIRFAGTQIVHMPLMSWGGEAVTDMGGGTNFSVESSRSMKMVRSEGVVHDDPNETSFLWNEERN